MTHEARVILWGRDIGAVTWVPDRGIGVFQYTPEFAHSGIEVAPMMMPLRDTPFEFPSLSWEGFMGLPGMLADSLPDRFGTTLVDAWLSLRGREPGSFTPVERLCYTGTRGMGALEFRPDMNEAPGVARKVDIEALVAVVNRLLDDRIALEDKLAGEDERCAIEDILHVGTSAGGAQAKAVLAWNPDTGEFRSGQAPIDHGFSNWLMKFDGVRGGQDDELAGPQVLCRIEYAYHLMAHAAGIRMEDCRLHEEGGRAHFMTRRFDRTPRGDKLHLQSLGGLMHYDYNFAGAYAYEEVLQVIVRLGLPMEDVEQQVRRSFFNILARNQDDHVKNIAFLMDRRGVWRLSPAFDVTYSCKPSGAWTSQHQMSLGDRCDGFDRKDLIAFAGIGGVRKSKARSLLAQVSAAVADWRSCAERAGVPEQDIVRIERAHRQELLVQDSPADTALSSASSSSSSDRSGS